MEKGVYVTQKKTNLRKISQYHTVVIKCFFLLKDAKAPEAVKKCLGKTHGMRS